MMATTLWTQLLEGMRADGMIAHCVTQSGPATTKVIVDTCQAVMENSWLRMSFLPQPGREVIASKIDGSLDVLRYVNDVWWRNYTDFPEAIETGDYYGWRYVQFHKPEQVEVEHAP